MDDVDVLPLQDLAEVFVSLHAGPGNVERCLEMAGVYVTDGEKPRTGIPEVGPAHASDADNRLG
jgi:hypothetical protein